MLPLTFLSAAFMRKGLMPNWMQHVADYNPVNWAVESGRSAVTAADWSMIGSRAALLVGLAVIFVFLAPAPSAAYQRSL